MGLSTFKSKLATERSANQIFWMMVLVLLVNIVAIVFKAPAFLLVPMMALWFLAVGVGIWASHLWAARHLKP
jgi:hypothetical protein